MDYDYKDFSVASRWVACLEWELYFKLVRLLKLSIDYGSSAGSEAHESIPSLWTSNASRVS